LNAIKSKDGVVRDNLKTVSTLGVIILLSVGLVLITIWFHRSRPSATPNRGLPRWNSAYFLLIGLGFMFVEMALIQRISVYLGHPVYGLAIGLFGIIVSTGFGSLLSSRVSLLSGRRMARVDRVTRHAYRRFALLASCPHRRHRVGSSADVSAEEAIAEELRHRHGDRALLIEARMGGDGRIRILPVLDLAGEGPRLLQVGR
jgi:hypothetical protein